MVGVGTFPFGWVRSMEGDNWQIIWDPKTEAVFAKGASSGKVIQVGKSSTWEDAKVLADNIIEHPESLLSKLSEGSG
ncbi:MAG: hypothetical protein RIG61_10425 [Deltaproteobacteria bacterium]